MKGFFRINRRKALLTALLAGALSFSGQANAQQPSIMDALPHQAERQKQGTVIDGVLHALAASELPRSRAISSPKEAGILSTSLVLRGPKGEVGVHIRTDNIDDLLPTLNKFGFEENGIVEKFGIIEGTIPLHNLMSLDRLKSQGLLSVSPIYKPYTKVGSVTSQADIVMQTRRVQNTDPDNFDGTGVNIGILSDSYNVLGGAGAGMASGDLPAVTVVDEGPGGSTDEGRAMAELIHDQAPGAPLFFATAIGGQAVFAQNIRDLAAAPNNCKVIVDDIGYFAEPFFQKGLIGDAIDDVHNNNDVAYFTSAGNSADQSYQNFGTLNFGNIDPFFSNVFYDFDQTAGTDSRQRLTMANNQQLIVSLQWDDPFFTASGVDTDMGIFLLQGGTNTTLAGSNQDNITNQSPVEIFSFTNTTGGSLAVDIAIVLIAGPEPEAIKYANFGSNVTVNEFDTNSPTISPHALEDGSFGVGAIHYFDQLNTASFSSHGPGTRFFAFDGTRFSSRQTINSPEVSGIQGVNTTFFGTDVESDGFPNFFGTSASAPAVAAVAALLRQQSPGDTAPTILNRIQNSAVDVGAPGFDNIAGSGSVIAHLAVFGNPIPSAPDFGHSYEGNVINRNFFVRTTGAAGCYATDAFGASDGTHAAAMESLFDGNPGLNEMDLHLDLSGVPGMVFLSFSQREFNDEDNPMPATFAGHTNADGVAVSDDGGATWTRLLDLTSPPSDNVFNTFVFNLTQFASDNGLTLGSDVRVRFQQFDDFRINSDGMLFDTVTVLNDVETAVDLVLLKVSTDRQNRVSISWETAGEFDNAGFFVYSAIPGSDGRSFTPGEILNTGIIPAKGSETTGAEYQFEDPRPVEPGETSRGYFLEDVSLSGEGTFHGPVFVKVKPVANLRPTRRLR